MIGLEIIEYRARLWVYFIVFLDVNPAHCAVIGGRCRRTSKGFDPELFFQLETLAWFSYCVSIRTVCLFVYYESHGEYPEDAGFF